MAVDLEKAQMLIEYTTEIIQINISIWRIIYAVFEIFMLTAVFILLPVFLIKLLKWGWCPLS